MEDVLDADRQGEEGRPVRGVGPAFQERAFLAAQALEAAFLGQEGAQPGLALGEVRLQAVEGAYPVDCRRLSAASFTASTMCW
jgi:hypothetical protein